MAASSQPEFSDWLKQNKQQFLQDLEAKNADRWTVVMGNEAGDLDTIASSLSYSYLASKLQNTPTVALIQTNRSDLYLRPENLYAFSLANLDPSSQDMLCINDIPSSAPLNSSFSKFVLVDHNVLEEAFDGPNTGKVIGIIDHHADEGKYPDVQFREIQIVGSCTSLIAKHFMNQLWTPESDIPRDLATLLLTGVTIDTGGLKDDIATSTDNDSARFLYVNSTLAQGGSFQGEKSLKNLAKSLHSKKVDIGDLSTRDLLRRDYKDFAAAGLQVGLATVPVGLKDWSERKQDSKFFDEIEAYVAERQLAVLCILTTHKSEKHNKKRELLVITDKDKIPADVEKRLFDGLESSPKLQLKETDKLGKPNHPKHTRVWDQENTDANRKVIYPLVQSLIEGGAGGQS